MFPEVRADRLRGYVDKFVRLFLQSIYKWVQSPLSLHIGNLDLDRERALQLPVVHGPGSGRQSPSRSSRSHRSADWTVPNRTLNPSRHPL